MILTPIGLDTTDTIVRLIKTLLHGDALTDALVMASLQKAPHASTHRKVETSITFTDPYKKWLRKPWKFLFFFTMPLY